MKLLLIILKMYKMPTKLFNKKTTTKRNAYIIINLKIQNKMIMKGNNYNKIFNIFFIILFQ
jgi:hypothetical protein